MFVPLLLALTVAAAAPDPVLGFYRGVWHCEGTNYANRHYSLTYRYTTDADAAPALRVSTVYFIGKRRAAVSGQLGMAGPGLYLETGARKDSMWVSSTTGWQGNTLIWHDLILPGADGQDRLTVTRSSWNAFSELDQHLGPDGKPQRVNTTATCRRLPS